MNSREQIRQLQEQCKRYKMLNEFLNKKVRQQSDELLKVATLKGMLSKVKNENQFLNDENKRLNGIIEELEKKTSESKVFDIQRRQMQKYIKELEVKQTDLRVENLKKIERISALEYELKQSKEYLINLPPYGDVPQEVFNYIKLLENQLQTSKRNEAATSDLFKKMQQYLIDQDQYKEVDNYLKNYRKKRRGARQKITEEKIKTIKELRNGGMTIRDIASTTEISVGSVYRYLKN